MAKKRSAATKSVSAGRVRADEARHLMNTYKRPPIVFTRGRGCCLYDSDGREYLDFLGGIAVNALGHAHPRLVRVIRREAGRAIHLSNLFHNAYQGPLAKKLVDWSGLDRVFFTNSGTEAIDGALKLARAYAHAKHRNAGTQSAGTKMRILALENSFHGRTFGAVSITYTAKYREPFEPLVPGVEFVRFNDVADLEAKFDDSVCALVVETIQGEGGIFGVDERFWNRARELATEHDAALIADEIQCGLGRTGRYFAYQQFDSLPDIAVVAKPLAAGLPLGAIIANEKFASAFTPGAHGTTFGGGPLVCAAALEFLAVVEEENLLAQVRERGAELRAGLEKLAARFDFIREVRGQGLMLGVDLSRDGAPIVQEALRRGVIINCTHDHILRLLPPFIIRKGDIAEFLAKFEAALAATSKITATASAKERKLKTPIQTQPKAMAASRQL
ncbi:MAG TPA: aspartate aminotransferase family protein [Candidatus Acidoferrales bacterium]|nr:aspartate aminotransferase family protein [Candidatus Acidoferrales bacterium]